MSSYEKQLGELINQQYRVQSILGAGLTGSTYLCVDTKLNKFRIIKHIYKNLSVFDLQELMILKDLNYLNLPEVIEVSQDSAGIYIIQTYVEGENLQHKLSKFIKLKPSVVINITKQICDSLIYLHNFKHNGLVFNNIAPSNIIVTKDNKIILVDLCCIKKYYNNAKNNIVFLGNKNFKAPEYINGDVDKKSDIYSLGVVMYQLITGQMPYFEDTLLKEIKKDKNISKDLRKIILKCIDKNPNNRYQSVEELKNAINSIDYIKVKENKNKSMHRKILLTVSIVLLFVMGFSGYNIYTLYKTDKISKAQKHKKEIKKVRNLKQELENYKKEKTVLKKELDNTKKQSKQLVIELIKNEKQKQMYIAKLQKANITISNLGIKISNLNSQIVESNSQIQECKNNLAELDNELKSEKDEQKRKEIQDAMEKAEVKIEEAKSAKDELSKQKSELSKQKSELDNEKAKFKETIQKYKISNVNENK